MFLKFPSKRSYIPSPVDVFFFCFYGATWSVGRHPTGTPRSQGKLLSRTPPTTGVVKRRERKTRQEEEEEDKPLGPYLRRIRVSVKVIFFTEKIKSNISSL